jgi:hypothetical protein
MDYSQLNKLPHLELEVCVTHDQFTPCHNVRECSISKDGDDVAAIMVKQWGDDSDSWS